MCAQGVSMAMPAVARSLRAGIDGHLLRAELGFGKDIDSAFGKLLRFKTGFPLRDGFKFACRFRAQQPKGLLAKPASRCLELGILEKHGPRCQGIGQMRRLVARRVKPTSAVVIAEGGDSARLR